MLRSLLGASLLVVAFVAMARSQNLTVGNPIVYAGLCEASAAVAVPEHTFDSFFIVGDDESNVLRVYKNQGGAPVAERDITVDLGVDDDIDIETATWLHGQILFAGSHGRSTKGKPRPARAKLFAVGVTLSDGKVIVGRARSSGPDLRPSLAGLNDDIKAAFGPLDEEVKELAPEKSGLNLEGMTADASGQLILGFRNPIVNGKALLVVLTNPMEVILEGADPTFAPDIIRLDLGGRGVRSIEYSPAENMFYIAAGAKDTLAILISIVGQDRAPVPCRSLGLRRKFQNLKSSPQKPCLLTPLATLCAS